MPGLIEHTQRYRPIHEFLSGELQAVNEIIRRQLASDLPAVNELCRHVARYQGKMLRPTLTLLCGLAGGSEASAGHLLPRHTVRVLAAVTEIIHMATLVHDDVLDDSQMRRSAATVNHLRGNEMAVLLGDYLISNAFHLCSTLDRPEISRRIGETTNELCSGELLQVHHREDWSIDQATYFAIVERKTASLISLCCRLGAEEAGADTPLAEALALYGSRLGVAFQIQDDLLDLIGEERIVGKSLGRDLEKGKLTLPMIHFFDAAAPDQRLAMLEALAEAREDDWTARVRSLLLASRAVDSAHRVAAGLVEEARGQLAAAPESAARQLLDDLALAVISRTS
ncbi:MAG: polyprenyl synthetase family protein [Phycisphaerales bacterium]|nr:polyprenyl synthetase family protein [Phycisphaerales bacterium]